MTIEGVGHGGIGAKRKGDPYATETAWYRIKNPTYTQAEGDGGCLSVGDYLQVFRTG